MCAHNVATGLRMSLKWAPLSVKYVILEKKNKSVLDSEIYSTVMLIVASCLKQDELFLTTQTVIPVILFCRKHESLELQHNFRTR